jgi:hypothetical protein
MKRTAEALGENEIDELGVRGAKRMAEALGEHNDIDHWGRKV